MGEFLTACAHLENNLAGLLLVCDRDKKTIEQTWEEFLPLTFGQRLKLLIEKCAAEPFSEEHRTILEKEFARLKELVPQRNLIVHGTTFHFGFGEAPVQTFRVGSPKNNTNFMRDFIDSKGGAAHSFTAEKVRQLSALCDDIRGHIAKVMIEAQMERAKLESDKSP
ncbi:hypothetical protein IQ16_06631 [Bradyrhizobium huanghuaihaiense]|uniref:Uncharacterized protein n=2 Tax=Bradyrhizobium huanghuaihaiense TaxID=990078 RepID=A0A562QZR8_9BRAD|nr:hypothetical protein IQ16_06631 [Bradyrhizobium huanghuaihaiense]